MAVDIRGFYHGDGTGCLRPVDGLTRIPVPGSEVCLSWDEADRESPHIGPEVLFDGSGNYYFEVKFTGTDQPYVTLHATTLRSTAPPT
jgi:hypothetical protein